VTRKIPRWIVKGERLVMVCPACGSKKLVRMYDRTAACCAMVHIAPEGIENAPSSEASMQRPTVQSTGQ
jgi:hypothetical protein